MSAYQSVSKQESARIPRNPMEDAETGHRRRIEVQAALNAILEPAGMSLSHRAFTRWLHGKSLTERNTLEARFGDLAPDAQGTVGLTGLLCNPARDKVARCETRILTNEAGDFTSRQIYMKMPSMKEAMNTALAVNLVKQADPIFLLCQYKAGRVYSVAPLSFHQDIFGFLDHWKLSESKGNRNRLDNLGLTVSQLKRITGYVLDRPQDQAMLIDWLDRDFQHRRPVLDPYEEPTI
jgi:hypothetical protein